MSIKNIGHYEGIVEDPTNEKIEQMDIIHKTLYHKPILSPDYKSIVVQN